MLFYVRIKATKKPFDCANRFRAARHSLIWGILVACHAGYATIMRQSALWTFVLP
jgi:hypothetical protein